jgi:hypothetical protein
MKMLKDSVIRNREMIDCTTLKDIEQKRCELVGKSLIQLRNTVEADIELAKAQLTSLANEATQVSVSMRSSTAPKLLTCGLKADSSHLPCEL